MNCEHFDTLLADALGDELSDKARRKFDAHRAQCTRCNREYESLSGSIESLRLLPGSTDPSRGLEHVRTFARAKARGSGQWFSHAAFRFAASVLIAFVAGYALHAGLMIGVTPRSSTTQVVSTASNRSGDRPVARPTKPRTTLEQAFVNAHARKPGRTDLAKCLIALFPAPR